MIIQTFSVQFTMTKEHLYHTQLIWTGNTGEGTSSYHTYERSHIITAGQKPVIYGSSDPHFRGDGQKYNPEELLVASLASCHMLWFLHLCAEAGIIVTAYEDEAVGVMQEERDGSGRFTEVVLRPKVGIKDFQGNQARVADLHHAAHQKCFIANSCNFPVRHEPLCYATGASDV